MKSTAPNPQRVHLFDYPLAEMRAYFNEIGEKPFRAQQLLQWIHRDGIVDFEQMTNLSKSLRQHLQDTADVGVAEIVSEHISRDGTIKWLLKLDGGNCIETVFIPESGRGTLCVSSQVGCALNCSFCSTGKQGFNRNLSTAEIIGQLWLANNRLKALDTGQKVTNVVMMGMGEPLLNETNVIKAMDLMMDDHAYGLSKYRVTLSTSGLVPAMERLKQASQCALAVSLHAPTDELRNELVPINQHYPLDKLMACCRDYFADQPRRKVTFEYVMLAGVNDQISHAKKLIHLVEKVPCKFNLIPFNPFPGTQYQTSSPEAIDAFQKKLRSAGLVATVRKTRGDDIDGACGQLAGQVQDRIYRTKKRT